MERYGTIWNDMGANTIKGTALSFLIRPLQSIKVGVLSRTVRQEGVGPGKLETGWRNRVESVSIG